LRRSHYDYAKEPFWLGWQRLQLPREITETALAHIIGDKAEQAYRRSDALKKRRKRMDIANHVGQPT
jgi:hypothetical protein